MPLSWNEIRDRAIAFAREWADETREDAEAKSFWDAFFNVFGITRRRLANFEASIKQRRDEGKTATGPGDSPRFDLYSCAKRTRNTSLAGAL